MSIIISRPATVAACQATPENRYAYLVAPILYKLTKKSFVLAAANIILCGWNAIVLIGLVRVWPRNAASGSKVESAAPSVLKTRILWRDVPLWN